MDNRKFITVLACVLVLVVGFSSEANTEFVYGDEVDTRPLFIYNTSVHDPSVIKVDDLYYVFGSHMAAAKTEDLMNWTTISRNARVGNPLVPNPPEDMAEALEWARTNTFWAPDVVQLEDGRFYMYYCTCEGSMPLSALGVAVADDVEGPYQDLGVFLKSGMVGISPDGTRYNANIHPNAIDPHTFFDNEGKLWMVYGSYSGGIFILAMDPSTGLPLPDQGYGKKLTGGYHSRIEGPYILYSPDTDYYYLFLSFGGLAANDGYNIRVARSKNLDGPYYDANGVDMIRAVGTGSLANDQTIQPYGVKLMGNYQFLHVNGEPRAISRGYKSPGHNSAYYDHETGKYYLFFHTRFVNAGEHHEVRVHQMFINEDDWLIVAPHRYVGETISGYTDEEVIGTYKYINHGKDITGEVKQSELITLTQDGTISGAVSGTWQLIGEHQATLEIEGEIHKGVFVHQWDDDNMAWVMAFTALSTDGTAVWGSQVAK